MAIDARTLLDSTEAAINGLLTALANANVQEYSLPDGRKIQRVEFATSLKSLQDLRASLKREVASKNSPRIRLGKLGRRTR